LHLRARTPILIGIRHRFDRSPRALREGGFPFLSGSLPIISTFEGHPLYAQRQTNTSPRSNTRRGAYQRPPVRARVGLLMRKGSNFGALSEAEQVVRNAGLGLAPLSVSDEAISEGGVTILATAELKDLDSGALRGLVVPDGSDADLNVKDATKRALAAGLPVLAFGDSAALVAGVAGVAVTPAAAVLVAGGQARPLDDLKAVTAAAEAIG